MKKRRRRAASQRKRTLVARRDLSRSREREAAKSCSADSVMSVAEAEKRQNVFQVWKTGSRRLCGALAHDAKPDYRRYITLGELLEMTRSGQSIRVREVKSRTDITCQILMALWLECEERQPQFGESLLREIIRLADSRTLPQMHAAAFFRFMADTYRDDGVAQGLGDARKPVERLSESEKPMACPG